MWGLAKTSLSQMVSVAHCRGSGSSRYVFENLRRRFGAENVRCRVGVGDTAGMYVVPCISRESGEKSNFGALKPVGTELLVDNLDRPTVSKSELDEFPAL